ASTAAATAEAMQAAKAEAVQAAKEGGKSPASSYWGIVPAKLVNKDGAEWKWSCFRAVGGVHVGHDDRSHQAPQAQGAARQDRLLDRQVAARAHRHLLPEEVRVPGDDAGDGGGGAGDGGRDAAAPAVAAAVRAERRLDPGAAGGGGERADAPDDLHGGGQPQVVRARAGAGGAGRLLQRLLPGLHRVPQVRAPRRRLPGGGGHPLLHRVPPRPGGRQDRERPRPAYRHRLLAPPARRQAQGRRHRRARRRGAPPRRQPLRRGHPFPGAGAQQDACPARISLTDECPDRLALPLSVKNKSCC
uniref:Uncharacterized protein n=1 Tax=Aegilops tauschii subsp. strangulata TaxID=200361 RepID=A0A453PC73_AEGTS